MPVAAKTHIERCYHCCDSISLALGCEFSSGFISFSLWFAVVVAAVVWWRNVFSHASFVNGIIISPLVICAKYPDDP